MTNALFQGWTEKQMRAEFAKANAELSGLNNQRNDATRRKAKFSAMISAANNNPFPR